MRRSPRFDLAAVFVLSLFLSPHAFCRTWDVLVDGTGDTPTIQAGIDSAAAGDTVLVHDGIFTGPGNRGLVFGGKAIVLRSVSGPEETVIDCEGSGRGIFIDGEGYEPTVEGLTIRGGSAYGGGGILVEARAVIRNCRIVENSSNTNGGGICSWDAFVRIEDCLVRDNTAAQEGGGICVWMGRGEIRRSILASNTGGGGGGICCYGVYGSIDLDSCLVSGNLATYGGGGIAGGGDEGVHLEFRHTTVTGNRAFVEGGGIHGGEYYDVPHRGRRSIVWGNCAPSAAEIYAEPWPGFVLEFSDVDTSDFTGWSGVCLIESICEDPLFCDPADCSNAPTVSGDYSLDAASPCLPAQTGGYPIGVYEQGCDFATGVAEGNDRPGGLSRLRAFPNPFTGEVSLRYSLPEIARRPILVYDIRGRVVRTLEASGPAGVSTWDGEDESGRAVPPGAYFVRIGSGPGEEIRRIMRIR